MPPAPASLPPHATLLSSACPACLPPAVFTMKELASCQLPPFRSVSYKAYTHRPMLLHNFHACCQNAALICCCALCWLCSLMSHVLLPMPCMLHVSPQCQLPVMPADCFMFPVSFISYMFLCFILFLSSVILEWPR